MGGALWAASIADGPSAHPWPFNYAAGFLAIAVSCDKKRHFLLPSRMLMIYRS